MDEPITVLTATCYCKHCTLSFTIPSSSLPLPTHFCHCVICRHTHGILATIHTPVPTPEIGNWDGLKGYESSSRVRRWFCRTCGAHMVDSCLEAGTGEESRTWCVATALVDRVGEDEEQEWPWKFWGHIFVRGTRDGGLAGLVGRVGGRRMRVFGEREDGEEMIMGNLEIGEEEGAEGGNKAELGKEKEGDRLKLQCHCGGITLLIRRPGEGAFATFPPSSIPKDTRKWPAFHDFCTESRLTSSCAVMSWMTVEKSHISVLSLDPDGGAREEPYRTVFGTATLYESRPNVQRTFCAACGASVACEDREESMGLAVGLVRGVVGGTGEEGNDVGGKGVREVGVREVGVRVESWLEWKVGSVDEGEGRRWAGMREGLVEGMERREEREGRGRGKL
ncbi:hypothetical protein B0J11DRAFT_601794 [Dendryphion nanum]|uniref:CENP-V/GFA domain-containing protein n=1 Tax=Dendryphion nanum TaxID=256645 RepID=A0A9P9I686_9PLEO|nr:hypothetical protein B0J11DRAFT_601794 [Dendryphion nanum]